MRHPVLSRSVVGAAAAAVVSVAMTCAPSSAAVPAGVTHQMVLSVGNDLLSSSDYYAPGVYETLETIAASTCGVADTADVIDIDPTPLNGRGATGFVARVFIDDQADGPYRECAFGAIASSQGADFTLSGTYTFDHTVASDASGTVTSQDVRTSGTLSGNVLVTSFAPYADGRWISSATFAATGRSARFTDTTTFTRVETPKSPRQLKAAKKAYEKRLATAKKTYKNSLRKADQKKTAAKRKAAVDLAKRKYTFNKNRAKTAYRQATATYKLRRTGGITGSFEDFSARATSED